PSAHRSFPLVRLSPYRMSRRARKVESCEWICSAASTRRRSTAVPACTWSTSPARCAGSPTCGWGASAPSARSRGCRPPGRPARCRRGLADVRARGAGAERAEPGVPPYRTPPGLSGANAALQVLGVDLEIAAACAGADLAHSHTWYANFAGHVAKLLHGVPHVVTTHSLEPLRPWKAEQLGGGYAISSWAERTALEAADAVVAVSAGMRRDVLAAYPQIDPARVTVIHNGI